MHRPANQRSGGDPATRAEQVKLYVKVSRNYVRIKVCIACVSDSNLVKLTVFLNPKPILANWQLDCTLWQSTHNGSKREQNRPVQFSTFSRED